MATLDSLPADQRAVIQMVLQQGRTYDDIAAMLSIDRAGVRQRALDAFDALGPENSIPAPQRALLTDYLLGQLPGPVADQVRDGIADSPAQRAWLRVVASEVGPLATAPLPPIPASGSSPRTRRNEPALPVPAAPAAAPDRPSAPEADRLAAGTGTSRQADLGGSSRRGGAILLGVGAAVLIAAVVVVLVLTLGGGSSKPQRVASTGSTSQSSAPTTSTTGTSTTKAKFVTQVNLNSPAGVKNRAGVAQVISEGTTLGVLLVAQHVPANSKRNAYALWLYNSNSDSKLVGFVNTRVGTSGRLETEGALPTNMSHYKHMLVTLETQQKPKSPGPIVLEGNINLA